MKKDWKKAMLKDRLIRDPIYRHELSFVGVSSIAQQYYCEAKVEQEYTVGKIPTEVKETGTDLHAEIFAMEPVKREDLVKRIEKAPHLAAAFRLYGEVGKLRVIGEPDAVVFEKGIPKWLIELKTTRGDHTKLWDDQLIQVRIYGLLLDRMGFDCSELNLVLIRMRQKGDMGPGQKKVMLDLVRLALEKQHTKELESRLQMKFFVFPYSASEPEKAVMWAQGYWLKAREPIPTRNASKCKPCEYNQVCPYSLHKPNL
ncbi:MAG: PD-(D/E)XK nuclease family protein [Nitrososphaerota archaeon]|nr:PD-(D/E)XK nuclease family protein [Nitrososphaerota archaeon]